ncbi:DUF494 family protein [Undibacterium fentianense]|uniref:Protein Smg homolog n=1 Tax=Undibacterium fentianense TaxID=2828728 RepID=A0A941E3C7_9BURK|nr:DUF494 domain-containing protein [Undibacterium fentianense]MBR7800322.1 DUF494 domain-containing protein [Undibacterium fentianense]
MFEILVYLYQTYYRPETCPDSIVLAKKLSSEGFDEDEIVAALDWLSALADTTNLLATGTQLIDSPLKNGFRSNGFRVYTEEEKSVLGLDVISFLYYLQQSCVLNEQQREVLIECAMAVDESPLNLAKFKVIVLMLLWSQGHEAEMQMFDEFLKPGENLTQFQLH